MKLYKPNDELQRDMNENKLACKSIKRDGSSLKIVYHNQENGKDLRIKITCEIPDFLTDEMIQKSVIKSLYVYKVNRYMGYATMICSEMTLQIGGDSLTLKEKA